MTRFYGPPIANRRSFNTVVIDPGHGGHDSGTRNRISREADIQPLRGQKLRDRLKTMGYQVVMTRDTDNFIALQDRVRIANRHNNAIFISIHFNDGGSSARGVETFTLAPAGTSSSMSRNIRHDALQGNARDSMNIALATAVQGHMLKGPLAIKEGISMVDRGIKRARYSVLCTIKHPAILVEGGFMSNPQEALLIATERYQISWPLPWLPLCINTAPPLASKCAERAEFRTCPRASLQQHEHHPHPRPGRLPGNPAVPGTTGPGPSGRPGQGKTNCCCWNMPGFIPSGVHGTTPACTPVPCFPFPFMKSTAAARPPTTAPASWSDTPLRT